MSKLEAIIELYDHDSILNLYSMLFLKPRRIHVLWPQSVSGSERRPLFRFAKRHGMCPDCLRFYPVNEKDPASIKKALTKIAALDPGAGLDLTGGDGMLMPIAALSAKELGLYAYTIDARKCQLYPMDGSEPMALPELSFMLPDIIMSNGGSMEEDRGDMFHPGMLKEPLRSMLQGVFYASIRHTKDWNEAVHFFQQVKDQTGRIRSRSSFDVTHSTHARAARDLMEDLEKCGAIRELKFEGDMVSFYFDPEAKDLLRDFGIWLELNMALTFMDDPYFDDAALRVQLDWDGINATGSNTENEVDMMLLRGLDPIFISCKQGAPSSLDLAEIQMLTRRFGGRAGKAVLVTASDLRQRRTAIAQRAEDIGVYYIDRTDILSGKLVEKMHAIADGTYKYPELPQEDRPWKK